MRRRRRRFRLPGGEADGSIDVALRPKRGEEARSSSAWLAHPALRSTADPAGHQVVQLVGLSDRKTNSFYYDLSGNENDFSLILP